MRLQNPRSYAEILDRAAGMTGCAVFEWVPEGPLPVVDGG
jgi:hypothetical protein